MGRNVQNFLWLLLMGSATSKCEALTGSFCQKKKNEWILAGTCIMWMQTVMLAATIELPYGRCMLPNVGVSRLLDLACVP